LHKANKKAVVTAIKIADIKSCKPYSGISQRIGFGARISFQDKILRHYNVTGFEVIERVNLKTRLVSLP